MQKLKFFQIIYPYHFITLLAPSHLRNQRTSLNADVQFYEDFQSFIFDPKFKLIFDFSGHKKVKAFYKKKALKFVFSSDIGFTDQTLKHFISI